MKCLFFDILNHFIFYVHCVFKFLRIYYHVRVLVCIICCHSCNRLLLCSLDILLCFSCIIWGY